MASSRKSAFRGKRFLGGAKALKALHEYDSAYEGKVVEGLKALDPTIRKNDIGPDGQHFPYHLAPKKYWPDVVLPSGICIEIKGMFDSEDRTKLLTVKAQNPGADIRIVFQRPSSPLYKGAKSTYGDWAAKHGFPFCKGPDVPPEWLGLKES